jgi:secreted trypsin-like serine protease
MRKKGIGLVIALLMLAVTVIPVAAITWGQPDTEHTNVGAMVADYPGYGPYQVCSGTLVHPRVVLTAGHCTVDWEGTGVETFWVNFDPYALNEDTLHLVEEVIPHPDYWWGPTSNPYDVGVLVLAEPVKDIEPANLPDEGLLEDLLDAGLLKHGAKRAKFTAVGYGGLLEWPPPDIYYEDMRQYADSEFQNLHKIWLRLSQNQATGNGGTCFGDSGGPIFWTAEDGMETLVAVTSWGDAVCVSAGFNYRVDIADTLDFITEVIDDLD